MKSTFIRGILGGAAAAFLWATLPAAQTPAERVLSGMVELSGEPVPSIPVTLHRVTPEASGPLGSQVSSAGGEFSFRLPPPDSAQFEVYFVTAEYLSVRYFGQPVHGGAVPDDYPVAVYDTASTLPGAIRVARRDIVLLPEAQGGWEANEIIRLHNSADRTLVSSGGMPTWQMRLPDGVTDFQAGEGEMSAAEIVQMGDRVLLTSSILPGDRELYLRYRVPLDLEQAVLPIGTSTDTLNVFVGQPSPAVEVEGLQTTNVVDVQGERFVQYGTSGLTEGEEISLAWEAPAGAPLPPEIAGSAAALLVLLIGSFLAIRARGASRSPSTSTAG